MWIIALILALAAGDGAAVSLQTLDGGKVAGTLAGISREGVTLETADGRKTLPYAELMELAPNDAAAKNAAGRGQAAEPSVWIELLDGSKLVGTGFTVHGPIAKFQQLHQAAAIEIPTRQIVATRLQPLSEETAAEWKRISSESDEDDTSGDLLVTRKGDTLDYHRGVVADVSQKTVNFNLDGDVLPVRRGKVFAIIYRHTSGQSLPGALCRLVAADGSTWAVQSMELKGNMLAIATPCGLASSMPLASVERLDFSQGKVVFLGNIEPQSSEWTPYFGGLKNSPARRSLFGPRVDRGPGGEPIRLGGKEYSRGIILHSRSEVVYRLEEDFRRFRATAGIDDRARPRGHVRLVIRGDDRVLLDTTLSGSDRPRDIDLDLGGARKLSIFVDFGDGLDVGDHLDLAEARVVK